MKSNIIDMTLKDIKKDILKQIKAQMGILIAVPFYDYPEEKIFALEEIQHNLKVIKTIDELKSYNKRVKQMSIDFDERAKVAKTKSERDECLGLKKGYNMGHLIIQTEMENAKLQGKTSRAPKKTASHKITAHKTKN